MQDHDNCRRFLGREQEALCLYLKRRANLSIDRSIDRGRLVTGMTSAGVSCGLACLFSTNTYPSPLRCGDVVYKSFPFIDLDTLPRPKNVILKELSAKYVQTKDLVGDILHHISCRWSVDGQVSNFKAFNR